MRKLSLSEQKEISEVRMAGLSRAGILPSLLAAGSVYSEGDPGITGLQIGTQVLREGEHCLSHKASGGQSLRERPLGSWKGLCGQCVGAACSGT